MGPAPQSNDYVDLQQALILSIDQFNTAALEIQQRTPSAYSDLTTAESSLQTSIQNLKTFLDSHKQLPIHYSPTLNYNNLQRTRQKVSKNADFLSSMNGAPKKYNQSNNIYDEYRANYNSTMFLYLFVSVLVVLVLYIYYSNI